MPRLPAFCRTAPSVRFSALAIFAADARPACLRSDFRSAVVQGLIERFSLRFLLAGFGHRLLRSVSGGVQLTRFG